MLKELIVNKTITSFRCLVSPLRQGNPGNRLLSWIYYHLPWFLDIDTTELVR